MRSPERIEAQHDLAAVLADRLLETVRDQSSRATEEFLVFLNQKVAPKDQEELRQLVAELLRTSRTAVAAFEARTSLSKIGA